MYIFYIITLFLYFFFHHLYHWCCVCLHLPCMFRYSNLFINSFLFIVYSVNNHYVVLYKCTKIKIYILDIDECTLDHTCLENSMCVNETPGYHCECIQGFESQEDGTCTSNTKFLQLLRQNFYSS